jgi:hypothetical protein
MFANFQSDLASKGRKFHLPALFLSYMKLTFFVHVLAFWQEQPVGCVDKILSRASRAATSRTNLIFFVFILATGYAIPLHQGVSFRPALYCFVNISAKLRKT